MEKIKLDKKDWDVLIIKFNGIVYENILHKKNNN